MTGAVKFVGFLGKANWQALRKLGEANARSIRNAYQQSRGGAKAAQAANAGKAAAGASKAGSVLKAVGKKAIPGLGLFFAIDNFRKGDYVGALLNVGTAVPVVGPVFAVLSIGWEVFGFGDKNSSIKADDPPNGTTTHILPGSAESVSGVQDLDRSLREVNNGLFAYRDGPNGTLWHTQGAPDPLIMATPDTAAALKAWTNAVTEAGQELQNTLRASSEPYVQKLGAQLATHIQYLTQTAPQEIASLGAELSKADKLAATAYQALLDTNVRSRNALAQDGALTDSAASTTLRSEVEKSATGLDEVTKAMTAATTPNAVTAINTSTPTISGTQPTERGNRTTTPTTPAPNTPLKPSTTAPGAQPAKTDEAKTPAAEKKSTTTSPAQDALLDALKSASKQQSTPASTPSMPSMPSLGSGSSPLGGGSGVPTSTPMSTPQQSKVDDGKKVDDDKKVKDSKVDDGKKDTKSDKAKVSAMPPAAAPTTRTGAKPAAPAAAAPAPGAQQQAAAPEVPKPGAPKAPDLKVSIAGQDVEMPNEKKAKMLEALAGAEKGNPMSLSEAATKAGLTPPVPGQDPGQQIAPTDREPGDIRKASGHHYVYLGEDVGYYSVEDQKLVSAAEVPASGDDGGWFQLVDPAATADNSGASAPGQAGSNAADGSAAASPSAPSGGSGPVSGVDSNQQQLPATDSGASSVSEPKTAGDGVSGSGTGGGDTGPNGGSGSSSGGGKSPSLAETQSSRSADAGTSTSSGKALDPAAVLGADGGKGGAS